VLVTKPPNRLRVLPHNWRGRHQIAKAQARSLLDLGCGGGVLPESRCQRLPKPDLSYDQPYDGQTEYGNPDSEDAANEGVCFHASTLVLPLPRALIERICWFIDANDGDERSLAAPS
jgi:hypothetical protein